MKLPIYLIAAGAFAFVACKEATPKNMDAPKPGGAPMMMKMHETVEVRKSNPAMKLKLAGELAPDQQTELFPKVNSYVKNILVDIGDKVNKGQVLMVLEAPEIQSQLNNAKAKWQAQEAILYASRATYERMEKANLTKGAIARDALDQIKAKMLADEAQLNSAKSAYEELIDVENYLVIRAPFSGVITDRTVDVGAYVSAMSKPLLVLQQTKVLRLNLSIPEAQTHYLKIGDTIRFKVRSLPQNNYFAILRRKSGTLDLKLRSEKIQADFMNTKNELKPYMVAETVVQLQNTEPGFFIPKAALVESNMGVYIISIENGKTKNVPVAKGRVLNDQVEVFGDLDEGDRILKMASEEIQEGTVIGKGK